MGFLMFLYLSSFLVNFSILDSETNPSPVPPPALQACKANSSFARVNKALTAVFWRFLSDLCRAIASTIVWIPRGSRVKNEAPKREMIRIVWQSKAA